MRHTASTLRRIRTICLQLHANFPGNNGYSTGNFTCWTHASSPATGMPNCPLLRAKAHASCWQKKTGYCKWYCYHTAREFTCQLQVNWFFITCGCVYSGWGSCRVYADKFTCFYWSTACTGAGKLSVGSFYMRCFTCKISPCCRYCSWVRKASLVATKPQRKTTLHRK